jgi:hypothetical protein
MMWTMLLVLIGVACNDTVTPTECAKVLCAEEEYCLSVVGGVPPDSGESAEDLPECAAAPEGCGGVPSCDCLPECSDCTDDGDGVYCQIYLP